VPAMRFSRVLLFLALLAPTTAVRADEQDDTEKDIQDALQQDTGKPPSAEELTKKANEIVDQMAKIRELPKLHPVTMEVATREQIVKYVDSRIQEEMKPDELSGQEAALKRLGLVPENMDMRKFMLDLYGEQVAGYYDPFKGKFFIASWMGTALQAPIMAHELTHALQDQHFNLKPFLTPIVDNSDATSARQAVVEGDASVAMFAWLGQQNGLDLTKQPIGPMLREAMKNPAYPVFQAAPAYFQASLAFPYADGSDFILATKNAGGWKAVSDLYSDLPRSSEQILHPEKYKGPKQDDPTAVSLPLKLDGWKQVHTDVLGEVVMRVLMEGYFDESRADTVAAGWDGDRYRAYQKTGARSNAHNTMVVQRSTWDSATDAQEYLDAWRELLPKKYDGTHEKADKLGSTWTTATEEGAVRLELKDKDVVIVDGAPDPATAEKIAAQVWAGKR
jgi:hypothetical protein